MIITFATTQYLLATNGRELFVARHVKEESFHWYFQRWQEGAVTIFLLEGGVTTTCKNWVSQLAPRFFTLEY